MKAIHFRIDFQKWPPADINEQLIDAARNLEAELHKRNIPTVSVLQSGRCEPVLEGVGSFSDSPPPYLEFLEQCPMAQSVIPLSADSLVAYKGRWDLSSHHEITRYIIRNGFDTAILGGLYEAEDNRCLEQGNFCVSVSARGLSEFCKVIIAAEATNCAGKIPLQQRRDLHSSFARIETTQDILAEIDATGIRPLGTYHNRQSENYSLS